MKKLTKIKTFILDKAYLPMLVLLTNLFLVTGARAQPQDIDFTTRKDNFLINAGLETTQEPSSFIADVIKYLLSFLGVIFLVLIIYGGFLWMTARGNEEQVERAKKVIIRATIGLVIVLLAYAITYTITKFLIEATGEGSGGAGGFNQ